MVSATVIETVMQQVSDGDELHISNEDEVASKEEVSLPTDNSISGIKIQIPMPPAQVPPKPVYLPRSI
jgi:hypothetical protein